MIRAASASFRRRRVEFVWSLLRTVPAPIRLLDVGGTPEYWQTIGLPSDGSIHVTLLNLDAVPVHGEHIVSVAGDARDMREFSDRAFDVAFSNSVIEHVGGRDQQRRMADEVQRVAARYIVQTPNLYFPIEAHAWFPFFQFLPTAIQVWLVMHFDVGTLRGRGDHARALREVNSVNLLDKPALLGMFPHAKLWEERVLGMTKSITAYGGWDLKAHP